MTDDITTVELDEMDRLASAVHALSDKVVEAADDTIAIDYDAGAFGVLGAMVAARANSAATRASAGLHSLAQHITADATAVTDTALAVRHNEQAQVQSFRSGDDG
jgi:hypothetical protein